MSWNHVCRFGTQREIVGNANRYGAGPGGLVFCLANRNEYSAWSNLDENLERSGRWDTFTADNDEEVVKGLNERGVAPGDATVTPSGDLKSYVVLFYKAGLDAATITLAWGDVHQKIDGFGAFAGRAVPFFEAAERDSFMEHLWGDTGLRLNMIRGEVLHTYPFDKPSGAVTIKPAEASIDDTAQSLAYRALSCHQKEHLAQLWILKRAKERYQVPIIFASAWTPPLDMKSQPKLSAKGLNGLNYSCCSNDFAGYLAGFAKSCQDEDIGLYGISPCNEPENVLVDWQSSYWPPNLPVVSRDHLGEFIRDNLRPKLSAATKIISPENAAWGTAKDVYLPGMDTGSVDILASHGYAELVVLGRDKVLEWLHIKEGEGALHQSPSGKITTNTADKDKPVWVTEACDAGAAYDGTMSGGLRLAINMHRFLTECNVSAYVYWLGMLDFNSNEALLGTNPDGTISYPKTYHVMGQYSRYVRAGYQRFSAPTDNSTLRVSAYKNPATGDFSVVVINPGEYDIRCKINLPGFTTDGMKSYLTTDRSSARWQQGEVTQADGGYEATVPRFSVVTFTGKKS